MNYQSQKREKEEEGQRNLQLLQKILEKINN